MPDHIRHRHLQLRSIQCVILSVMLTAILLTTTGCAAFLVGSNRKAYNLMVEASDYFKYPSSVQIVSGELYGDGMYCVIRGKNSFGAYRSDTYYVTSSGYPLEDYDSRCHSDKLNCDLINNALAAHYGNRSTNGMENWIGGMKMNLLTWIIVLVVLVVINGILASQASKIAVDKGYGSEWLHMCFWLGPVAYIIIAAMPDKKMRNAQEKTNQLLATMIKEHREHT